MRPVREACKPTAHILDKERADAAPSSPRSSTTTTADGASENEKQILDAAETTNIATSEHDNSTTDAAAPAEAGSDTDVVRYYTPVAGKEPDDDLTWSPPRGRLMDRYHASRRSRSLPDGGAGPQWTRDPFFSYWRLNEAIEVNDGSEAAFWDLDDAIVQFRKGLHAYRNQNAFR